VDYPCAESRGEFTYYFSKSNCRAAIDIWVRFVEIAFYESGKKKTPASPGLNPSEIFFINLFYEEISTLIDEGNLYKVLENSGKIYTACWSK
jgi:hypothetical protein